MDPLVSVIIPTRTRPAKLRTCLDLLANQKDDTPPFEVLVALDGPCPESQSECAKHRPGLEVVLVVAPRHGIAVAKNYAIDMARGTILLLINDDILPEPGFVAAHSSAHQAGERLAPGPVMVVGHSPWVMPPSASLFDRLLAQSSMIFFYDQMIAEDGTVLGDRDRDWGYRHAWNLNLSLPTCLAREVGGFCPAIANCCYEDIELAWRIAQSREGGVPVLFRPEARAPHDHHYTPASYLEREYRLGYSAYGFAKASPGCAKSVFGLELDSVDELAYAARFIAHEGRAEPSLRRSLESLASIPAAAIGVGPQAITLLKTLEQQQIMLKRLAFRRGLIFAAEGGHIEGLFHPSDRLPTCAPLAQQASS